MTTPLLLIIAILLLIPAAVVIIAVLFKAFTFIIKQVFTFIFGMIGDTLRLIGILIMVPILSLLVVANIVIGRWSAAGHFGRGVTGEVKTFGAALYRLVIGHPARLFCLTPLTEGIERRLPEMVAAAPGPDKPSRRTGAFEGYQVTGSLPGGGSGGKLYLATPDERKRGAFLRQGIGEVDQVVIKSFHLREGSSLPQIVRESRSLESARKMGLVLEHELTDERFYYVMRYAPGESLTRVTQQMHAMTGAKGLSKRDMRTVLGYSRDLLDTLAAYHAGGLWHKDVKPDNIIVDGDRARLVDFGLITHLRSAMTLTTHGTEYFRDPEMVRMALRGVKVNEVDGERFDVYGAGAVLYSMVENSFPAHGGLSRISQPCPEAVRWIVRRAMTDYDKRYRSAREMLADLQYVLASEDMFAIKPAELPSMGGGSAVVDETPEFDSIWMRILGHSGKTFKTTRGHTFSYAAHDAYIVPSIDSQPQIYRSQFERAWQRGPTNGPGAIPDVLGPSYVWAILHDDRINAFQRGSATHVAHHAPPPPMPDEPAAGGAKPKPAHIRVLNWWSGSFTVSDDDPNRPVADVPVSVGAPAPAFVRSSAPPMPGNTSKRRAREQVAAARQRAHDRRNRAHQRRRGLTGKGNKSGGARFGVGLAIILVVLPAVAAALITVGYTSSNRTPYEEGRRVIMSPPAPQEIEHTLRIESTADFADKIREAVRHAPDRAIEGTLLVIRDATGLSLEERAMLEHRLAALRAAGVRVLDAHNAGDDELEHVTELLAKLRARLGMTDPRSATGSKMLKNWVYEHDDVDALYWIAADEHDAAVAEPLMRAKGDTGESILRALRQLP